MNKLVSLINWVNGTVPAINDSNLNKMDREIDGLDDRIITLDTGKLDKTTAYEMVKSITYAESTGIFTVTYLNGTTSTLDTKLEKLAVNFEYDSSTEKLVITLSDGTKQYVDMSSLITEYNFEDSSTIDFSVTSGKVKADVIDGSITGAKLEPNYLANVTTKADAASSAATTASSKATEAKSYAVGGTGTRTGEDTDNAKYYYEQASAIVGVGIATTTTAGIVKPDGTTISVLSDGTISAEVITYGEDALTDDVSELTSNTMYCQVTDGTIVKSWIGVDGVAKPLSVGSPSPEPSTELTFLVEGAKGDNITVTDESGEIVSNVIFDSDATSKEVTIDVVSGANYTFTSSIAKATDGSGSDYSKVITLPLSDSDLSYVALIPEMTSNTTPKGVASSSRLYADDRQPYMAFGGDNYIATWVYTAENYVRYSFESPVCAKKMSVSCMKDSVYGIHLYNFDIQASNDGVNWVTLKSERGNLSEEYETDLDNDTCYTHYQIANMSNQLHGNNYYYYCNFRYLQFYGKGVKVMPSGALYWYGNKVDVASMSALSYSDYSSDGLTFNTNAVQLTVSSATKYLGISSISKLSRSLYNKVKLMLSVNSASGSSYLDMGVSLTKATSDTMSPSERRNRIISDASPSSISNQVYEYAVSDSSDFYACARVQCFNSSINANIHALWLE